ncbi:unnamed protein product [Withania somnifera]
MMEDDSNWFAKWEEELPSPKELIPLSQTLISPKLAIAFDIQTPKPHQHQQTPPPAPISPLVHTPSSAEFDLAELGGNAGSSGGCDEPASTQKRARLVWTPQLHKRFVDAVAQLGIKNAVPKTIMQLMSVDGLTRENVASHLQKYRLYLKRMQGLSNSGNVSGAGVDAATDHLFASSPVPAHFLHPGKGGSENYMPFVPMTAVAGHAPQLHQQYRHLGSPPNGQFEVPFLSQQSQQQVQRMGTLVHSSTPALPSYVEELESATAANGRKVLTLFPTGINDVHGL